MASASLNETNLIRLHGTFNLRFELTLVILNVLVAFHRVSLACASLPIGKDSCMVAVDHLSDHSFDTNLLIEVALISLPISHLVERVSFGVLVAGIEFQSNGVACVIYDHLATCIGLITSAHN